MNSNEAQNRKSKEKSYTFIKIAIAIITLVFIFIIYKIFNTIVLENNRIDLSGDIYYQYFYGIYEEYSGKLEIFEQENSKQLVLEDGKIIYLDSTPIYYKDTLGKVLFPSKMEVVYPEKGKVYMLDDFSNIIQDSNVMYAKRLKKDNKKSINNSFIYDGEDLYFFLEETTIKVGKKKYKLSPLSYAIVNYRQNIEFYDYKKDEYIILDEAQATSNSDVIATNKNKDYEINLSIDSFSTDYTDQLLIRNMDYLTELDY